MALILSGDTDVVFSGIAYSSTDYSDADLEEITALTNVKQIAPISNATRNGNKLVLDSVIDNTELEAAYYINTVGIQAYHPDYNTVIYAVAIATTPGYMPVRTGSDAVTGINLRANITVGNANNVSVTIDPAGTATVQMVTDLDEKKLDGFDELTALTTEMLNDDEIPVGRDGEGFKLTKVELAEAMNTTTGSPTTTSDNPATYDPGVYRLNNAAFNTAYWPIPGLYGIMHVMKTSDDLYKVAHIICSGGGGKSREFFGYMRMTSDTVFYWTEAISSAGGAMSGQLIIDNAYATPMEFRQSAEGGSRDQLIAHATSARSQLGFRQFNPNGTYYEDFYLPQTVPGDNATKVYSILTTKDGAVGSVSVGDSTYISSVSGGYVKLGRLVVFSIGFKAKTNIAQSVPNAISGLPSAVNYGRFLVYDNYTVADFSSPRFANISGTALTIKGAYTANETYYISGAYISAS